jgi:predicted metal-dependent hydrolase
MDQVSLMKRIMIIVAILLAIGALVFAVSTVRRALMRPDVRTMAAYSFGDDLKMFYAKHHRLPNDWNDYSQWYASVFPSGRRDASWARKRFDIPLWGKSAGNISN